MAAKIEVGSMVKYKREFLRDTGQYTGPAGPARGVVTELKGVDFLIATVDWGFHSDDLPNKIAVCNLRLAEELEPA